MKKETKAEYKVKLDELVLPQADKEYISIHCPKCKSAAEATNINITDKIAKCGNCSVVYSFSQDISSLGKSKEVISRPKGIELYEEKGYSEITLPQPNSIISIIIATSLPLILLILCLLYFKKGLDWALYPMIGTAIVFLYSIFDLNRKNENKIFISIENRKLIIQHRPQNFVKDIEVKVNDIQQIYVTRTDTGISLMVSIDNSDGEQQKVLISRLSSVLTAKFLEQELERMLGIKNKRVIGETYH